LPTVLPKPSGRPADSFASGAANKLFRPVRSGDFPPKKFGADRAPRPAGSFDKGAGKPFRPAWKKDDRASRPPARFAAATSGEGRPFSAKPAWKKPERPARSTGEGFRPAADRSFDSPSARPASRPAWKKDDRAVRPPERFAADSTGEGRPAARPFPAKPAWKKPERFAPSSSGQARSDSARPASRPVWKKDDRPARPDFNRSSAPRREAPVRDARVFDEDQGPVRPPNLHIEEITGPDRSSAPRASSSRSSAPRQYSDQSRPSRPRFERPASSTRPFTTSSGKPRAGGARPSSKSGSGWKPKPHYGPGKPASGSSRPFTPRTEGASDYRPTKAKPYPNSASRAERKAGPGWKPKSGAPADRSSSVGWKPKTRYGPGKPAFGSRSKPKPGSSAKPSHRIKPSGKKRG
jgi:translation initiation factor IF-2